MMRSPSRWTGLGRLLLGRWRESLVLAIRAPRYWVDQPLLLVASAANGVID
jgi:hypothetical protein